MVLSDWWSVIWTKLVFVQIPRFYLYFLLLGYVNWLEEYVKLMTITDWHKKNEDVILRGHVDNLKPNFKVTCVIYDIWYYSINTYAVSFRHAWVWFFDDVLWRKRKTETYRANLALEWPHPLDISKIRLFMTVHRDPVTTKTVFNCIYEQMNNLK